jgi:predicted dehydrogenase
MHTIAIIGAGNIGSRHLQAFGAAKQSLKIILIDPSQASLDTSKARWEEVGKSNKEVKVIFQKDFLNLPKEIDFAVISTNSEHRLSALKNLLQHTVCANILLEKFLFFSESEYAEASSLIEKHKVNTYVNVVRRTFESYQWVFEKLKSVSGNLGMKVIGNNWGMASNSIHFVDLFCYLANDAINTCEFQNLETATILPSKREGYVEFFGDLSASGTKGNKLTVSCHEGEYDKINIVIEKGNLKIHVEEKGSEIAVTIANEERKFPYPFQSQLTLRYFNELMEGKPSSVSYKESSAMHVKFLHAVKNVLLHKNYQHEWKIT